MIVIVESLNNSRVFSDCKAHWLALMLTANRDKMLFDMLHAGMEACINHLVRMASLSAQVPRSYGEEMAERERAVRAKASGVSRVSPLSLAYAPMHNDRSVHCGLPSPNPQRQGGHAVRRRRCCRPATSVGHTTA